MYFTQDDDGSLRPMTHDEMVETYNACKPHDLLCLADLYIDFELVDDVEFLVFQERLSAAVLMAELATSSLDELASERAQLRTTNAHRHPGWEHESDLALEHEEDWIAGTAEALMFGGAAMAAIAALEALIGDLDQDAPRGLQRKAEHYLSRAQLAPEVRGRIEGEVRDLARARNGYAHRLDGSPWARDPSRIDRTECKRIFTIVGRLGVELTGLRPSLA